MRIPAKYDSRAVGKLAMVTVAGLFFSLSNCASVEPHPTKERPLTACVISCPAGYARREQHICKSDRRWFHDIRVIGESSTRGADGMKLTDLWISQDGDYAKTDVVFGACSTVMRMAIAEREPGQRGQFPGEDDLGRPKPQP